MTTTTSDAVTFVAVTHAELARLRAIEAAAREVEVYRRRDVAAALPACTWPWWVFYAYHDYGVPTCVVCRWGAPTAGWQDRAASGGGYPTWRDIAHAPDCPALDLDAALAEPPA